MGLRAGWRLLAFITVGQLLGRGLDWLVTQPLGYKHQAGWDPLDFIVDGASSFCIALVVAWFMSRIEHRTFSDYGLPFRNAFGSLFWEGMLWGFVTSTLVVAIIWAVRAASFHGPALRGTVFAHFALLWLLAFLLVGLSEEFLFRGYTLRTLTDGMGFWPASLLLSLLFGVSHILKPRETFLDIFNIILFGLFWCLTLRRTGNLWFAVGFHAMSDYTDMVIYAEPNTGNNGQPLSGHLLDVSFHGPAWLTGGICGTEASVVALAVLVATFMAFHRRFPSSTRPVLARNRSISERRKRT